MDALLTVLTSAGAGGVAVAILLVATGLVKAVKSSASTSASQSVQCQVDHASTRNLLERMVDSHENLVSTLAKIETRLEILFDRKTNDREHYIPKGYI